MKNLYAAILLTSFFPVNHLFAQCTTTNLNWDYLEFFPSAGLGSYTDLGKSQNQKFAFGKQMVTITHNYSGENAEGENGTHSGETGSYGTGADVEFVGNGIITFTFQDPVQNVKFSVYDIDVNQVVQVTATNGTSAQPISTMARVSGTSLTIAGSGTNTASATAANGKLPNHSTEGAIKVDITGPVTGFTLTVTNTGTTGGENGSFWLSDIEACSNGSFTSNYFLVSKPFTGQPGYVLTVKDNNVYYLDPATGNAKFIFRDTGCSNLNSMAYDPTNHFIYYVYSLSGPNGSENAGNKVLRRYDYNMDTFGIVVPDITSFGVPTFDVGVESGSAGFYDSSLYIGIEANASSAYETIIWRIEFNSSHDPISYSQVYAMPGNGHDWADIGIANGVLYDFDGSSSSPNIYHADLVTRNVTAFTPGGGFIPRQIGIDWNGQVYNIGPELLGNTGLVAPYLYDGTVNAVSQNTITINGNGITGNWGDAAEAFRPKVDFGDAPSTYDPDPLSPALNECDTALYLGASIDIEWSKTSSAIADADGSDEDGLAFTPILASGTGSYNAQVSVYNNTGSAAVLIGWLDYNGNGMFDASEGITPITVPSAATAQNVWLFWPTINNSFQPGDSTYLRIRLAGTGMTTFDATGFFNNGETEDYRVLVDNSPLSATLLSFIARATSSNNVKLEWTTTGEANFAGFDVQRSADNSIWSTLATVYATGNGIGTSSAYAFNDTDPLTGKSFYRLKLRNANGQFKNSEVRVVNIEEQVVQVMTYPNPAFEKAFLSLHSLLNTVATVSIIDMSGRSIYWRAVSLQKGANRIELPVSNAEAGMYLVRLKVNGKMFTRKLIVTN